MATPAVKPRETGTVVAWHGDHGFARADVDGAGIFLGTTDLAKTGVVRLAVGDRVLFARLPCRFGGTDRATNVKVIF